MLRLHRCRDTSQTGSECGGLIVGNDRGLRRCVVDPDHRTGAPSGRRVLDRNGFACPDSSLSGSDDPRTGPILR